MRLIPLAERYGIEHYAARHEQVAVGMADGYYRSTGRLGVVLVGRGPGLTNGTNSMVTAAKARSGVLVIAGELTNALARNPEAAARHLLSMKTVDQVCYLTALGVFPVTLDSAQSAIADFRAACDLAASGRTVAVLIRGDVLAAEAGEGERRVALPAAPEPCGGRAAADEIELVADLLVEEWASRRPLIIAGRGALGAISELTRLAELSGALVSTTLRARGAFRGDPFDIGVVGTMSSVASSELILQSDLVLAFGASLNPFTTYGGDFFRNARVVHIDTDVGAIGNHQPAEIEIVGEAKTVAQQLIDELERRGHTSPRWRTPQTAETLAAAEPMDDVRDESVPAWVDPRIAAIRMNAALPEARTLVFDNGAACIAFGAKYLEPSDPYSLHFTLDYGSVGAGFGPALGAAVANRDQTVVLCCGDGGFMMALPDLDTAVRYDLPVVFFVMNDHAFGQEIHLLGLEGIPDDFVRYGGPSLEEVAHSFGARGITIDSVGDLDGIEEKLDVSSGPIVVDCRITVGVRGDHVDLIANLGHGSQVVRATSSTAS